MSAVLVAGMALFLAIMIYRNDDDVLTGWDFAIPVVGAAAALLWRGAMYVSHRAQALREQRFGESLRDQLNRRLAQLDYQATRAPPGEPAGHCAAADGLCDRHHPRQLADQRRALQRRWVCDRSADLHVRLRVGGRRLGAAPPVQRDVLPRKRRLEALLKELDAP